MSAQSALASLTATYTDSDGEEDDARKDETIDFETKSIESNSNPGNPPTKSPVDSILSDHKSPIDSRASSPLISSIRVTSVTTRVAKLVSYHDDTLVSDDEEDGLPHQIIVMTDNEQPVVEDNGAHEEDGVVIPPEPTGQCSTELQEKIAKLYEKMQTQHMDMNAAIQKRKDFRNPSIYEKLIQFCAINELGTNYPPAIYDPLKWTNESFYEELAIVQKAEMDKREKERKGKVEIMTGTKKAEDDSKKRKSKWDMPGGGSSIKVTAPGLAPPTLTTTATGTKSTVISAFGSLPKKPKP